MNKEIKYLKYFVGFFIIGLTIFIGGTILFIIKKEFQSVNKLAVAEGKASYNKDLLYRRWASMHGGVYVPVTDTTPPNPYLSHIPDRDITTEKGKKLTLINPAYMTRQVFEIGENHIEIKGHITSLNPLRKENKPDDWEIKALQLFEKGELEYSSIEKISGKEYMRFMHAMKVEQSCLKCHSQQGYKVGDIRGGISVSVPMEKYKEIAISQTNKYAIFFLLIYVVIIFLSIFGYKRFLLEFKKRLASQKQLIESEKTLKIQNNEYAALNEKLLKAKQKAEESDRLKSAFLANTSHEIRTPMNGILGFAALLSEPGLESEEQQKYIKVIQKSGARMLNIISEIVDISKIESGLTEVNINEVNITEKLESVYELLKPDADAKAINLFIKDSLPMDETVFKTDEEKLFAILSNLVKNAIKYTDKGSIEFGYSSTSLPNKINELQFYVKDTGIGIPKDRQQAIFKRFIQADIADLQARQGAGLGLSIAKAFVEMLDGKIWVESEQGKGSCFYFTLPCNIVLEEKGVASEVVSDKSAENYTNSEVSGLKILIAEDDEVSMTFISISVEPISNEILVTTTGVETIEVCRNNPDIDLILMDIQMPDINGYEATRQIRQFNKDVVIIAQTAFGLSGDREKAIEAGCNDYIAKPIKKDELLALIQKCLAK